MLDAWGDERVVPAGITAAGILLTAVGFLEGAYRVTGPPPVTGMYLAGLATSLPFSILLIGGGVWLRRSAIEPTFHRRIALWCLASALSFAALIGLFAPLIFDAAVSYLGAFRWSLAMGGGGGFLIGVFNVRMIERMLAAERAAVRAEEADQRREFLEYLNALLRHEVLNTANVIDGQAALLEREGLDSERPEIIRQQASDLTEIIDDVRFLVSASDDTETTRPVDLCGVLEEECERLTSRHEQVAVETDLPDETRVPADDLIHRLFRNLLENAVEHNDEDPRVTVRVSRDETAVSVQVTDDGPGVPPDLRSNLFDPAVSRQDDESRLGTVIVGRLADRYDGRVTLAATGDEGTTIRVRLPHSEPEPTAVGRAASGGLRAANPGE